MANEPCSFSRFRTCSCNWSNQCPSQKLTRLNLGKNRVLMCSISIVCTGRGQRYPHLSLIFAPLSWLSCQIFCNQGADPGSMAHQLWSGTYPLPWTLTKGDEPQHADNSSTMIKAHKPIQNQNFMIGIGCRILDPQNQWKKNQFVTLVTERLWQFVARICSNNVQNLRRGWKTSTNPVSNSLRFCWIRSQMTKHQLLHIYNRFFLKISSLKIQTTHFSVLVRKADSPIGTNYASIGLNSKSARLFASGIHVISIKPQRPHSRSHPLQRHQHPSAHRILTAVPVAAPKFLTCRQPFEVPCARHNAHTPLSHQHSKQHPPSTSTSRPAPKRARHFDVTLKQHPAAAPCSGTLQRHPSAAPAQLPQSRKSPWQQHSRTLQRHPAGAAPAWPLQAHAQRWQHHPQAAPCNGTNMPAPKRTHHSHTSTPSSTLPPPAPAGQLQSAHATLTSPWNSTLQPHPAAAPCSGILQRHQHSCLKAANHPDSSTAEPCSGTLQERHQHDRSKRTRNADSITLKQHPATAPTCLLQSAHTTLTPALQAAPSLHQHQQASSKARTPLWRHPETAPCSRTLQRHPAAASFSGTSTAASKPQITLTAAQQNLAAAPCRSGTSMTAPSARATLTASPSSSTLQRHQHACSKAHTPLSHQHSKQHPPSTSTSKPAPKRARHFDVTLKQHPAAAPCSGTSTPASKPQTTLQQHPATAPACPRKHNADSITLKQHPATAPACLLQSAHTTLTAAPVRERERERRCEDMRIICLDVKMWRWCV